MPGLNRPDGSSAVLIARMTDRSSGVRFSPAADPEDARPGICLFNTK